MKNLLRLTLILFIGIVITGCASKKIYVYDENSHPIENAMVLARQQNMLYPNSKGFFITDKNGMAEVPYIDLVVFDVGKEGYDISNGGHF